MQDVAGKVALVTGAGRGIGRGIALAFGAAGVKVVVASRTRSTVEEVTGEIVQAGGAAIGVVCDVGQREQVFGAVTRAVEGFGRLDILVNNAQGFGTQASPAPAPVLQPLEDFDEDQWDYTFRTGATATLWGMKAAFPHLKARGGTIVNIGSTWGQRGEAGGAAYNATKEAIRALTRTAAREWGQHKITVNVINPAVWSDTMAKFARENPEAFEANLRKRPLQRVGDAVQDAGGLCLFLASPGGSFMTGMTFLLDGGGHMWA